MFTTISVDMPLCSTIKVYLFSSIKSAHPMVRMVILGGKMLTILCLLSSSRYLYCWKFYVTVYQFFLKSLKREELPKLQCIRVMTDNILISLLVIELSRADHCLQ